MNFIKLKSEENNQVWEKFFKLYNFKPSTNSFPSINFYRNQIKFDIKGCYCKDFSNNLLESTAIEIFTKSTKSEERIYALNWQHDCFDFNPRHYLEKDDFNEWLVPIFPNGDYYIFLTKDFKNIWFGHPWENSITIIGDKFVKYSKQLVNKLTSIGLKQIY